ncbi:hypothetical protein SKAU_G00108430 [Synaphobranchus kaupii]|uniref:Uncharacterized protein n=1 Tax=Synaphobranchus kaupii TaxID=118154 RepID=A0A9Q1J5Z1_SYNKA|nr:hypothetical protein SKAU_G00108430 [Synaphobranchus kaupii]
MAQPSARINAACLIDTSYLATCYIACGLSIDHTAAAEGYLDQYVAVGPKLCGTDDLLVPTAQPRRGLAPQKPINKRKAPTGDGKAVAFGVALRCAVQPRESAAGDRINTASAEDRPAVPAGVFDLRLER